MQARIDLHTFFIFPSVYLGSCFYYKCVNQQLMNEGEYHMKNIWYERGGGGWRELRIWKGWDARRKFWIKPLKETDTGVAQALFDP